MNGRKRFVAVDSLGLIWAVLVTTADAQEGIAAFLEKRHPIF